MVIKAGLATQGINSIAIGRNSGITNQHQNSIILNSSGSVFNSTTQNSFYVLPIRESINSDGLLTYNTTTKEINNISSVNNEGQILTSVNNQVMNSYPGYNYRGSNFISSNSYSESLSVPINSNKWNGGVLAPNGKLYYIPFNWNEVYVIDPNTNNIEIIPVSMPLNAGYWVGGVLAPNGKIYGIPGNAPNVLIIDPMTNTVDTTTMPIPNYTVQLQ